MKSVRLRVLFKDWSPIGNITTLFANESVILSKQVFYDFLERANNAEIFMDHWTILGVFLLGIGSGALLTAISFAGRLREIKAQLMGWQRRTPRRESHAEWPVEKEILWWEMARRN